MILQLKPAVEDRTVVLLTLPSLFPVPELGVKGTDWAREQLKSAGVGKEKGDACLSAR